MIKINRNNNLIIVLNKITLLHIKTINLSNLYHLAYFNVRFYYLYRIMVMKIILAKIIL